MQLPPLCNGSNHFPSEVYAIAVMKSQNIRTTLIPLAIQTCYLQSHLINLSCSVLFEPILHYILFVIYFSDFDCPVL